MKEIDIDIVDVKKAIAIGQLEVDLYPQSDFINGKIIRYKNIILRDTKSGEAVKIGEVR